MDGLSHLNERGEAVMVDVGNKAKTNRAAVARGVISMSREVYDVLRGGGAPKGDVLGAARIAGIMAAKRTGELIPLCHPLMMTKASVDFEWLDEETSIEARCAVACEGKTGVEMEALTGVAVALLTLYDMAKALQKDMVIGGICLLSKAGGRSGTFLRGEGRIQ